MEAKMKKQAIKKQWWESKRTVLLKQYAHDYGGEYVAASLKKWRYTAEHVKLPDPYGLGTYDVSVRSNSNSNSTSTSELIEVKFTYRPRRKLEFSMTPAKRLNYAFHRNMDKVTMPNTVMSKLFQAVSTHPSLLRSVLKHEGLAEELMMFLSVKLQLRIKEHTAVLTWTEPCNDPDLRALEDRISVMKQFVRALYDQNIIHETK